MKQQFQSRKRRRVAFGKTFCGIWQNTHREKMLQLPWQTPVQETSIYQTLWSLNDVSFNRKPLI